MARCICGFANKQKFPNRLECDLAIADIQLNNKYHRRQKQRDEPTRSYLCESCGHWHMTSKEKRSDETVSS